MNGKIIRKLIVQNFHALVCKKDICQLYIQGRDIEDEGAIILFVGIPFRKVLIEWFFQDIQVWVQLEDLVEARASTPRMSKKNDTIISVHFFYYTVVCGLCQTHSFRSSVHPLQVMLSR